MKHTKDKNFYRRGMTFLELMVAMFVLIVGISGTVGLIQRTISSAAMSVSQLKAAYLAKEGVEVVRNIRDSNWVRNVDWLTNIECVCCEVAFDHNASTPMTPCSAGATTCPQLRPLVYSGGFYRYVAGTGVFRRMIETTRESDHLRVEVTVCWNERGSNRSVTVVEKLYNWR